MCKVYEVSPPAHSDIRAYAVCVHLEEDEHGEAEGHQNQIQQPRIDGNTEQGGLKGRRVWSVMVLFHWNMAVNMATVIISYGAL